MTAGTPAMANAAGNRQAHTRGYSTARSFYEQGAAQRVNTDMVIVEAIRKEYPSLHLTVVPQRGCDLLSYAAAGKANLADIAREKDKLLWRYYAPPASRLSGSRGAMATAVKFGKYLIDWSNKEFVVYVVEGRDGSEGFPQIINQYVLSADVEATNELLIDAGVFTYELHNEVWVFDQGYWQKNAELWDSVQKASWDDVILDASMKKNIRADMENFFSARDTYERLRVPWKRGIIFYGPPGNGKTISLKAIMHQLNARRPAAVPTLYVKTLASFVGPEYSLGQIFSRARATAPCLLVFEDLDSIVTDSVRSYFLNEVDGIRKNDGILMLGSTNHLERLDPGISKRPSRFDRKYLFPNPDEEERTKYMQYWQAKLADNKDVDFPDKLCPAIAKITDGFSFAYLQEAMVASLLAIAREEYKDTVRENAEFVARSYMDALEGSTARSSSVGRMIGFVWEVKRLDEKDPDLDKYVLWREVKKQVRILREELDKGREE